VSSSPGSGLIVTDDTLQPRDTLHLVGRVYAYLAPGKPRSTGLRITAFEAAPAGHCLSVLGTFIALLALADLALRAALRQDLAWDTVLYHLPFAALRGGVPIPYDMNDEMRPFYEGFPPLPHLVQGALWRLTGSMRATNLANYLALAGLLGYGQRVLRAPFWLVALIALTAPMAIIQASATYVDLFGNAFLAAGAASCLYVFLLPERAHSGVLLGALGALAAAAWSKYQLVPVAGLLLCIFTWVALARPLAARLERRQIALLCAATAVLAAGPYLKNLMLYGNPFWPIRVPLFGDWFPYTRDALTEGYAQRPVPLRQLGQFALFFHSLLELNHPQAHAWGPRWSIDQGHADIAFRMGGFWGLAAAVYLLTLVVMLVTCFRRRGLAASAAILAILGFVAMLPQSNELRYYLFIPLSGAAMIGMLFRGFSQIAPRSGLALVAVAIGLFLHMAFENRSHYQIERIDSEMAARAWGAAPWWPTLAPNTTYCAVGLAPMAILLTGPHLSEHAIVDRSRAALCPPSTVIIRPR
jgi:hypothetical protein